MKGWLDKYNDGGPVQENYNDYSVSAGPGFEGDGTFNKGRNYSPAWGGQFEDGGELSGELPNVTVKGKKQPIVVTDPNDPRLKAYKDSLIAYNKGKDVAKLLGQSYDTFHNSGNRYKNYYLKNYETGNLKHALEGNEGRIFGAKGKPLSNKDLINTISEYKEIGNTENIPEQQRASWVSRANALSKLLNLKVKPKSTFYNAELDPIIVYKKPTQPVMYQERTYQTETPELQDLQMGMPVDIPLPELHRPAGPNRITMGKPLFPGGPQTDYYTPIDEAGNVVNTSNWSGGKFAMGGSMPGAVGFTYARTNDPAPSNGKYAKKTMASAQNGEELKKDVKTVDQGMLPEITVVGSSDPQTEEFYRSMIDEAQTFARYEGMMDLGKRYGFPKVHPIDKHSIVANIARAQPFRTSKKAPANYNPVTKTIEANTPSQWVSEMAHHVQFKNAPTSTAFKFLSNDVPAYALGNSPYMQPGTMEHEAHSVIEPNLKDQIRESATKHYNLPYIDKLFQQHYEDNTIENIEFQNGGEMRYYQEGLDFKPKSISRDGSQLVKLDQLTNFTNYNTKQPGGWLDKYEG